MPSSRPQPRSSGASLALARSSRVFRGTGRRPDMNTELRRAARIARPSESLVPAPVRPRSVRVRVRLAILLLLLGGGVMAAGFVGSRWMVGNLARVVEGRIYRSSQLSPEALG